MKLRRHMGPGRLAAAAVTTGLGFWLCDFGTRYILALLPSLSLSSDAPVAPEFGAWAAASFATLPLGLDLTRGIPLLAGIIGGIGILLTSGAVTEGTPSIRIDPATQYGTERFATVEERAEYEHTALMTTKRPGSKPRPWPKPSYCETLEDDNYIISAHSRLGFSDNPDRSRRPANKHIYVMAGSGAGKTYNFLRSNVLQVNASMVFTDMKGENFRYFAKFLKRHGYKVKVFNLRGEEAMTSSSHFNPLHYVHDETGIDQLIEPFIKNTTDPDARGGEDYFVKAEKQLYSALLGYLFFMYGKTGHEEEFTLPKMLTYLSLTKSTGGALTKLDLLFDGTEEENGFYGYRQRLCDLYGGEANAMMQPEWAVITSYDGFKSVKGAEETMSCIVSSCFVRLQPFVKPAVAALFSSDDMELETFGQRKTALFVITPDTGSPYYFAVCMLLNSLFGVNIDIADGIGAMGIKPATSGHLDIPINCYLDELANIGVVPNLEKLFATVRSRWINLVAIVQDGHQLENTYGKTALSIRSNCSTFLYLGASDHDSCEEISKQMGKTTVEVVEWSQSQSNSGGSTTKSVRYVSKDLMSTAEIENVGLGPDRCLTHYSQARWFVDEKPDPEAHPRAAELVECGEATIEEWADEVKGEQERVRRERIDANKAKRTVLPRTSGTGLDVFVTDEKEEVA